MSEPAVHDLPEHLSPSQVTSLLDCGWRFYLERVAKVPQRPMWAGVGGTVVHRITEDLDRQLWEQETVPMEQGE